MNMIQHQAGHRTEISIHWELKKGFDNWVKGLRSITQSPEESRREVERRELTSLQSDLHWIERISAGRQWDEDGRWQDDGGRCATVH